jgi:hypothetical protein
MSNRRDELVSGGAQINKLISGVAMDHAGKIGRDKGASE